VEAWLQNSSMMRNPGEVSSVTQDQARRSTPTDFDAESPDPLVHRGLVDKMRERGDELGALAHLIVAQTLEAYAAASPERSASALRDVATGYFMKGEHVIAAGWYRLVLTLDPDCAVAYQNLAAICSSAGLAAEAASYRQRAYKIQRIFLDRAGQAERRVLVLCTGAVAGNLPFEELLPAKRNCRIKFAIDYATEEEDEQLPPFDIAFNAIGEPDVAAGLLGRLERFASRCEQPLLNSPAAVVKTQRHRLPQLLHGLDDVVTAACIRLENPPRSRADLMECLSEGDVGFPLLARPVATHGGEGMIRYETIEALEDGLSETPEQISYLTQFYESRNADGYYRKYRMIFVDGEPFPYHLAISRHWVVHYFSAEMETHPWKLEEERRFLERPDAILGARAMSAICKIGRRLGLAYGGIDFTLLPDGRVLVFEANATMLAHRERNNGPLAYKNVYAQRIFDAFERLLARGADPWRLQSTIGKALPVSRVENLSICT
jgi:tetratricopeptide (TPR) repeat protein